MCNGTKRTSEKKKVVFGIAKRIKRNKKGFKINLSEKAILEKKILSLTKELRRLD